MGLARRAGRSGSDRFMSKPWQPCALHILDAIERIRHIQARGDLTGDQVLYNAALHRN